MAAIKSEITLPAEGGYKVRYRKGITSGRIVVTQTVITPAGAEMPPAALNDPEALRLRDWLNKVYEHPVFQHA